MHIPESGAGVCRLQLINKPNVSCSVIVNKHRYTWTLAVLLLQLTVRGSQVSKKRLYSSILYSVNLESCTRVPLLYMYPYLYILSCMYVFGFMLWGPFDLTPIHRHSSASWSRWVFGKRDPCLLLLYSFPCSSPVSFSAIPVCTYTGHAWYRDHVSTTSYICFFFFFFRSIPTFTFLMGPHSLTHRS